MGLLIGSIHSYIDLQGPFHLAGGMEIRKVRFLGFAKGLMKEKTTSRREFEWKREYKSKKKTTKSAIKVLIFKNSCCRRSFLAWTRVFGPVVHDFPRAEILRQSAARSWKDQVSRKRKRKTAMKERDGNGETSRRESGVRATRRIHLPRYDCCCW